MKPENIILMMYSSVATAYKNPYKDMLFTDPAETTDGDWVKYGCLEHVDYMGDDIRGDVFLGVVAGNATKVTQRIGRENPRVLNATINDTVFTYFIDHGADERVFVGYDEVSHWKLSAALKEAYDKKLYGKWVWFMEACHSGSMFSLLPDNMNIYAMTSSDYYRDANMSNCPPDDVVAGQALDTCEWSF